MQITATSPYPRITTLVPAAKRDRFEAYLYDKARNSEFPPKFQYLVKKVYVMPANSDPNWVVLQTNLVRSYTEEFLGYGNTIEANFNGLP